MKSNRATISLALLTSLLNIVTCGATQDITSHKVRSLISRELRVGSTLWQVQRFFKVHNFPFAYDRFENTYDSNIGISAAHSIFSVIYLDRDKNFLKADVRDIYTGP